MERLTFDQFSYFLNDHEFFVQVVHEPYDNSHNSKGKFYAYNFPFICFHRV